MAKTQSFKLKFDRQLTEQYIPVSGDVSFKPMSSSRPSQVGLRMKGGNQPVEEPGEER